MPTKSTHTPASVWSVAFFQEAGGFKWLVTQCKSPAKPSEKYLDIVHNYRILSSRVKLGVSKNRRLRAQILEVGHSKYVGLDVHKDTIAVAQAEGEVRYLGEIANI